MKEKTLPDEGLEKAELQLAFFGKEFRFRDPMDYHEGRPNVIQYNCSTKAHNRRTDNMFDILYVKERFKKRRMYLQAMKSYCKNNKEEALSICKNASV